MSSSWLIVQIVLIPTLVFCSAMFSGLTLGLLGLDKIGLRIVLNGDDPLLAHQASRIMPIREDGNLLLCTLLLGNVAVNASLSILLADLTSGILGFALSTAMIVIFGEIVPQALCSRYALYIGSMFVIRTIMKNKEKTDERTSAITKHSKKVLSILSGKWNNCVYLAENLKFDN